MKKLLRAFLPALLLGALQQTWAQTEDSSAPKRRDAAIRVEGVTIYGGYYTSGTPAGFEIPTQSPFLGPTAMAAATLTVGGSQTRERSSLTWSYSPSYFSTVYSSEGERRHGSVNHRFGMHWRRQLGQRWSFTTSANGLLASLEQLYFSAGPLTEIAALPTNFDDLASAVLTGRFTDAQLAALLSGAAAPSTAAQAYPYGNRLLNTSLNMGVAWAPTGRTTVSAVVTGSRTQRVSGTGTTGADVSPGSSLPQMTAATAMLSWSYSLSPRTQIAVQGTSTRSFSRVQQGYTSATNFSVGRVISRRWFLQLRGGGGAVTYSRQIYTKPRALQYVYGANLAFKTAAQTFLVSYDRSLGDVYGFGSAATDTGTAAWNWNRPGSGWSVSASASYQRLDNQIFHNTRSWRGSAGVARSLGRHMSLSWQYVYFRLPLDIQTPGMQRDQRGINVSLAWRP